MEKLSLQKVVLVTYESWPFTKASYNSNLTRKILLFSKGFGIGVPVWEVVMALLIGEVVVHMHGGSTGLNF